MYHTNPNSGAVGAGTPYAEVAPPKPQTIAESLINELDRLLEQFQGANNRQSHIADRILGPVPENPSNGKLEDGLNHPIFTIALQQRIKKLHLEAGRAHGIADRFEQVA